MTNVSKLLVVGIAFMVSASAQMALAESAARKPAAVSPVQAPRAELTPEKRGRFQNALDQKFPRGTHALHARLAARLTPAGQEWVAQMASGYAAGRLTEAEVRQSANSSKADAFATLGNGGLDIEAMAGVKDINSEKEAQRRALQRLKASASKGAQKDCEGKDCKSDTRALLSATEVDSQALFGKAICDIEDRLGGTGSQPLSRKAADALVEDAKNDRDSMSEMGEMESSEMGEMESLRLQMAMDRLPKMMSTLSNLLKKVSETSQSITQNIK